MKTRTHRSGMALLEVMIALTLFTTVTVSLVLAFNEALEVSGQRNQIERALVGLKNQLALLHATRLQPQETAVPDDGSGIHYQVKVTPEVAKDEQDHNLGGFYRVEVIAQWKRQEHDEKRDITEIFYQP